MWMQSTDFSQFFVIWKWSNFVERHLLAYIVEYYPVYYLKVLLTFSYSIRENQICSAASFKNVMTLDSFAITNVFWTNLLL